MKHVSLYNSVTALNIFERRQQNDSTLGFTIQGKQSFLHLPKGAGTGSTGHLLVSLDETTRGSQPPQPPPHPPTPAPALKKPVLKLY